jgi:hypothetical protein
LQLFNDQPQKFREPGAKPARKADAHPLQAVAGR